MKNYINQNTIVEMLLKENQLIDMCKNKIPKGNKGKKKLLQVQQILTQLVKDTNTLKEKEVNRSQIKKPNITSRDTRKKV